MASEDGDKTSPWEHVVLTAICAVASVAMYLDDLPRFAPKEELIASQGIVIAVESFRWDDDLTLRLSDSERWYVFPFVEDDWLRPKLKGATPGALVTVAHAPPAAPPPGERHYVSAYTLAIDGREILTYEQSKAGYDSWLHPKWLSAFMAAMAALFAVLAVRDFLARAAKPER